MYQEFRLNFPHKTTFWRGCLAGTRALQPLLSIAYLPAHCFCPTSTTVRATAPLLPSTHPPATADSQTWCRGRKHGWSPRGFKAKIQSLPQDAHIPCTTPQGYCLALAILLPIFTSSVLPTTANGRWTCQVTRTESTISPHLTLMTGSWKLQC